MGSRVKRHARDSIARLRDCKKTNGARLVPRRAPFPFVLRFPLPSPLAHVTHDRSKLIAHAKSAGANTTSKITGATGQSDLCAACSAASATCAWGSVCSSDMVKLQLVPNRDRCLQSPSQTYPQNWTVQINFISSSCLSITAAGELGRRPIFRQTTYLSLTKPPPSATLFFAFLNFAHATGDVCRP